jgi:hypothetical protein
MTVIQIIQLILSLAPSGIQLTQEILALILQIEGVVTKLPVENQQPVAAVIAKALVTKA